MFNLIVDIWSLTEDTVNGEPEDEPGLLIADWPADWARLSGRERYAAAGAGVQLSGRMVIPYNGAVTERAEIRNVRTAEGLATDAAAKYYVRYVGQSIRKNHMALDLEGTR